MKKLVILGCGESGLGTALLAIEKGFIMYHKKFMLFCLVTIYVKYSRFVSCNILTLIYHSNNDYVYLAMLCLHILEQKLSLNNN